MIFEHANDNHAFQAQCVALTDVNHTSRHTHASRQGNKPSTSWLRSVKFTADGTSIIAQSDDQQLHTIVLPPDLLDDEQQQPHRLRPHASVSAPSSLLSFAISPGYDLADTSTTWVLTGETDQPIRLRNALDYTFLSYAYTWMHPTAEIVHGANSLAFIKDGAQFVAGTQGRFAIFDTQQPGKKPLKMHKSRTSGGNLTAGIVMAFAESSDGLLAIGTTNRYISLWSKSGHGEANQQAELVFSLAPPRGIAEDCPGTGITSMEWSPCQRYLLVAERQSDCVQIFDVRNGGHRLSWLSKRNARSTQRFDFSVIPTNDGTEVWAGGMDGKVRVWKNPSAVDGEQLPNSETALDDKPLGGVTWHPQGAVLATCSGTRPQPQAAVDDSVDDTDELKDMGLHNSLKVWSVI